MNIEVSPSSAARFFYQQPCPTCGYCPTCGRPNAQRAVPFPWQEAPWTPYQPTTAPVPSPWSWPPTVGC